MEKESTQRKEVPEISSISSEALDFGSFTSISRSMVLIYLLPFNPSVGGKPFCLLPVYALLKFPFTIKGTLTTFFQQDEEPRRRNDKRVLLEDFFMSMLPRRKEMKRRLKELNWNNVICHPKLWHIIEFQCLELEHEMGAKINIA